jgi:hypothetical protein
METYIFLAVIIFQWLFICWIAIGSRAERKELINEITNHQFQTHTIQPEHADTISLPHPETGAELIFGHVGNGHYAPRESNGMINNVAEVEGT